MSPREYEVVSVTKVGWREEYEALPSRSPYLSPRKSRIQGAVPVLIPMLLASAHPELSLSELLEKTGWSAGAVPIFALAQMDDNLRLLVVFSKGKNLHQNSLLLNFFDPHHLMKRSFSLQYKSFEYAFY